MACFAVSGKLFVRGLQQTGTARYPREANTPPDLARGQIP